MIKLPRKTDVLLSTLIGMLVIVLLSCTGCSSNAPHIDKLSPVDTSVLQTLANYPMYSLDNLKTRLDTLKNTSDGLQYVDDHTWNGGNGDGVWVYEYSAETGDENTSNSIDVYIDIYDTPENAESALKEQEGYDTNKGNPETVTISKDVNALLYPVVRYRNADNFYAYVYPAFLFTKVRFGNVVLDITEQSDDPKTIGTLTNAGLKQIVQVLEKQ